MKTAVIFSDGVKQIIFTPETDDEKFALNLITADDDIELLVKNGGFGDNGNKPFSAQVSMCQGGYLRLYQDTDSRIFVLTPRKKDE